MMISVIIEGDYGEQLEEVEIKTMQPRMDGHHQYSVRSNTLGSVILNSNKHGIDLAVDALNQLKNKRNTI